MPFLVLVLAERLDLDMTASLAPLHVFVKYRPSGQSRYVNLEATSGANPARDAWYRQNMPMTNLSIQNGLYLRPLSEVETRVAMTEPLMAHYMARGDYEEAIALSNLLLEYFPDFVSGILINGAAHYRIMKREFIEKFPNPNDIPPERRAYFNHLASKNLAAFAGAEALGWREPTHLNDGQYLRRLPKEKR